jgi:hypothetical protein
MQDNNVHNDQQFITFWGWKEQGRVKANMALSLKIYHFNMGKNLIMELTNLNSAGAEPA